MTDSKKRIAYKPIINYDAIERDERDAQTRGTK